MWREHTSSGTASSLPGSKQRKDGPQGGVVLWRRDGGPQDRRVVLWGEESLLREAVVHLEGRWSVMEGTRPLGGVEEACVEIRCSVMEGRWPARGRVASLLPSTALANGGL
jgi:hypothetical protein